MSRLPCFLLCALLVLACQSEETAENDTTSPPGDTDSVGLELPDMASGVDTFADTTPPGTDAPFPLDRGQEPGAPESYRGLPLVQADTGEPVVEAVNGKIGVVCIGPSFTRMECGYFAQEVGSSLASEINPEVVVVNCGVPSNGLESWIDPALDDTLWRECIRRKVQDAGLTRDQVRVLLHKGVNAEGVSTVYYPDPGSDYFAALENLDAFATRVPTFFPNVTAVYTYGRSYGGYNPEDGRSEPRAFESNMATNTWLSENPQVGGVWYGWGPYIWAPDCATGETNGSGVCYERSDYLGDGVHPDTGARAKIAQMMHARLSEHAWYRR